MNNDTIPYSSRSIRDGNASGGFLSKASSSLKRSPSKKHRRQSSNPLPSLEKVFYETQKSQVSEHNPHPQKRPDAHRNQTAPLSIQTTKLSLKEGKAPQSAVEAMMVVTPFTTTHRRDTGNSLNKLQAAIPTNSDYISAAVNKGGVPLPATLASASGIQTPSVLYQHIHEMANKRISTLDYFRKAHEGRVFWFNTVHFSRSDLSRLPNFSPAKLSRRATNYLLLGLSIPPVLDVHTQNSQTASAAANASIAYEFLKTLNALLGEFETYQQNHPPDGTTASALSRARFPHMFKRATHATTSRTRRTSSSAGPEIGLPLQQQISESQHHHHNPHGSQSSTVTSHDSASIHHPSTSSANLLSITAPNPHHPTSSTTTISTSSFSSFPTQPPLTADLPNSTLSPSEGPYTHLLTPPLPFAPDFYTVFATLCDVLIDTYQRILSLIHSPEVCSHGGGVGGTQSLGEMFAKADARLRKVIVGGVVREFEAAAREGGKREVVGVQRVVLGGLMGC